VLTESVNSEMYVRGSAVASVVTDRSEYLAIVNVLPDLYVTPAEMRQIIRMVIVAHQIDRPAERAVRSFSRTVRRVVSA
jgi:hypothetical protein